MTTIERIQEAYRRHFGEDNPGSAPPRLFRSPGRINLLGEHTDYNNGFVLPAGVDKAVYFMIAPTDDGMVELYAADLDTSYRFPLKDLRKPDVQWPWFQLAVLDQLSKHGLAVTGFRAAFGGDIPAGAGMSSSAALECCLLFALNNLNGLGLSRLRIVQMAQKAENEYVGVNCGIMDQFASAFSKAGTVIRLDCRSLAYEYFPFRLEEFSLILCDTTVKHSLASSEYNTRRKECEAGITILQRYLPDIADLRDVSSAQVEQYKESLGPVIYRRCRFVTSEIERVRAATEMLMQGDAGGFGAKMYETHDGLQHDYEVSCPELDFLVDCTRHNPDVAGARMMGGGFGGCTINLVKTSGLKDFENGIRQQYLSRFGRELPCYHVKITDGTEEIALLPE